EALRLAVGRWFRVQSADHLADQHHPILQGTNGAVVNRVEGTRDAQVRDGLLCRAARIDQELAELCHAAPTACLGYIRTNGEGCTHELISALELDRCWECAGESRRICGGRAGEDVGWRPS